MDFRPGEMIGLVGKSGAGKSTIINLICRFFDIDSGTILIDGHPIQNIRLQELRSQLGMVLQEAFLFNGTILENIKYGKPDASFDAVIRAAKAAHAHDFIFDKEDGYDTIIGEHGAKLSGGVKSSVYRLPERYSMIRLSSSSTKRHHRWIAKQNGIFRMQSAI